MARFIPSEADFFTSPPITKLEVRPKTSFIPSPKFSIKDLKP